MTKALHLFAVAAISFLSCSNPSADKQKETELKEKELSLKEQALNLREKEAASKDSPVTHASGETAAKATTDELSNVENLIGYWFVPHGASINIRFARDGSFLFNDYNTTLAKDETLHGSYQLQKGTLTLLYDDRPKQAFRFFKGDKGDNNYYIKKSGYYFVKGENGSNN